ncbi:MAG: hypothetical protein P9M03_08425 [Candidatus Theseobacter exili]|nr:hypothetical protein [Candidatus Theseobacter exili]
MRKIKLVFLSVVFGILVILQLNSYAEEKEQANVLHLLPNQEPRSAVSEELCSKAEFAFESGQWNESVNLYRDALFKEPGNIRAMEGLQKVEKAVQLSETSGGQVMGKGSDRNVDRSNWKKIEQINLRLESAAKKVSEGKYAEAIAYYGEVLSLDSENRVALRKIKIVNEMLDKRKKLDEKISSSIGKAENLMEHEKFEQAIKVYTEILKKMDPGNVAAKTGIELVNKRKELLLEKKQQEFIDRMLQEAFEQRKSGNFKKSETCYMNVLSEEPSNISAQDGLKLIQLEKQKIEEDKRRQEIARFNLEIETLLKDAHTAFQDKQFVLARKLYKKVLKIDSDNQAALNGLIMIKDREKVLDADKMIKDSKPLSPAEQEKQKLTMEVEDLLKDANKALDAGMYEKAEKIFNNVLLIDPGNSTAISGSGAIKKHREMLQNEQERLEAENKKKEIEKQLEKQKTVEEKRRKEAAEKQKIIESILEKADSALKRGKLKQADKYYKKILKVDSENKAALVGIASTNERQKVQDSETVKTEVQIITAAEKEKQDLSKKVEDLLKDANKALNAGKYEKAVERFNRVLEIDSANPAAISGTGVIEKRKRSILKERARIETQKRRQEREILIRKQKVLEEKRRKEALEKQKIIESILEKADSALKRDKLKQADKYYKKVLAIDLDNKTALDGIKFINERQKSPEISDDEDKIPVKDLKVNRQQAKINKLLKKAFEAMEKNKNRKAKKIFKKILSMDVDNKEAWDGLREVNRREEAFLKEKRRFEEKKKQTDDEARRQRIIAALLSNAEESMSINKYSEAEGYYQQVLSIEKDNVKALSGLIEIQKIYKTYDEELDKDADIQELETDKLADYADKKEDKTDFIKKDIYASIKTAYLALDRKGYDAVYQILKSLLAEYGDNPLLIDEIEKFISRLDIELKRAENSHNKAIVEGLLILRRRILNDYQNTINKLDVSDITLRVDTEIIIGSKTDGNELNISGIDIVHSDGSEELIPEDKYHIRNLLQNAESALDEGYFELSSSLYHRVLNIQKNNTKAVNGLKRMDKAKKRYIEQKNERQKQLEKRIKRDSYQRDLIGTGGLTEGQLAGQIDDLLGEARDALREGNILLAKAFFEHIVFIAFENPGLFERRENLRKEINGLAEDIQIAEERENARIEKVLEGKI